jgi:hypothetical protein
MFEGTHAENMSDMARKGRGKNGNAALPYESQIRGERCHTAKITASDIPTICLLVRSGGRCRDVGAMYGVSGVLVSLIARRKIWKHVDVPD